MPWSGPLWSAAVPLKHVDPHMKGGASTERNSSDLEERATKLQCLATLGPGFPLVWSSAVAPIDTPNEKDQRHVLHGALADELAQPQRRLIGARE